MKTLEYISKLGSSVNPLLEMCLHDFLFLVVQNVQIPQTNYISEIMYKLRATDLTLIQLECTTNPATVQP